MLLDTHVFLWWLIDDARLGVKTRRRIETSAAAILVSSATIWEIAIKASKQKLRIPKDEAGKLNTLIERSSFTELPIRATHAAHVQVLPHIHDDPFDRILVTQAIVERVELATVDPFIQQYPVPIISPLE